MNKPLILILALCALLMAQIVSTNEWPVAHNFSHTGFANTTVLKPPLKVKWMSKVSGLVSGESGNGAVVASGKVLIQGLQHVLVCLDAENGTLLWRKQLMQPEHGWHFFPCINGDKAYVIFSVKGNPAANGLYCLNLATGDSLWKQDAGNIGSFRQKDSPQYSKGKKSFSIPSEM